MKKNNKASSYCRNIKPALFRVKPLIACIGMSLAASALASDPHLSGAIFTTTPDGSIVNENVRYTNKEEVFLDGGPGPNAPASAAALPKGYYFFQVTDPSGKCLLSSEPGYAGVDGGTCYDSNKKGGPKNSNGFSPEPLKCRLFKLDDNNNITPVPSSYTIRAKVKGQWVETEHECHHQQGTGLDGTTIQLYPFANTPNNGGVYKAWVATRKSVEIACGIETPTDYDDTGTQLDTQTGVDCDGFFGFIPRWSKTDNYKVKMEKPPESFDVALRKFHDMNLNCELDTGEEYVKGWWYGVTPPKESPNPARYTLKTSGDETTPNGIVVFPYKHLEWLVDEYMWDATAKGVTPLNTLTPKPPFTNFTHFPSFAELRPYAAYHIDGNPRTTLTKPCCDPAKESCITNILAGSEDTGGFIPDDYGDAYTVKNGNDEEPVLSLAFGNFGVAKLKVCKVFANGKEPKDAPTIKGWKFTLHIPDNVPIPDTIINDEYHENYATFLRLSQDPDFAPIYNRTVTKYADDYGCATFSVLVPNLIDEYMYGTPKKYRVVEHPAYGWDINGYASYTFDVKSVLTKDYTPQILGKVINVKGYKKDDYTGYEVPYSHNQTLFFKNNCKIVADFDTKGYWHNKNGLQELTDKDQYYVNLLKPYESPSNYFEAGDEPFDGYFEKNPGKPVAAAFNADGYEVWKAGTWQSEVSHFLTDDNGNADVNGHKEQLAQQLLAFIFNTRHRPDAYGLSPDAQLYTDWGYLTVDYLINEAIKRWEYGSDSERDEFKTLLDHLNNNNEVKIIPGGPGDCPKPYFD